MTDLWCPGATAVEYEHFATSLLNRVLVKEVEGEDGRTKVIYPSISHKFIPELQANEHWADKLYAEDIQDLGKLQEHGMKLYLSVIKEGSKTTITRLASFEETSKTLEGSEKLQYPLHESQSISKFWNTLEETALEKAENALIQERHVSVQRRLEVDDGDNSRRGPGRNFKRLFQAISRKVGKALLD